MIENFIPCIKFPTSIIIVDDNSKLLENLTISLTAYKTYPFNSAQEVLIFLMDQEEKFNAFIKKHLSIASENPETGEVIFNLDIKNLHKIIFDEKRFTFPVVLISDYAMPEMDGAALSEKLIEFMIKIIMLTGEAGYNLAVDLFNRSLIDQFILKSDRNFHKKIKENIVNLENKFFQKISENLMAILSGNKDFILTDPVFVCFFNKLLAKYNIVEFYLIEKTGSFLLLDLHGNAIWLIVKNEQDMEAMYELAKDDEELPLMLIEDFKNKKKLVFDYEKKSSKFWIVEDAHCLKGREPYYYFIKEGTDDYYQIKYKFLPYIDYLNN